MGGFRQDEVVCYRWCPGGIWDVNVAEFDVFLLFWSDSIARVSQPTKEVRVRNIIVTPEILAPTT